MNATTILILCLLGILLMVLGGRIRSSGRWRRTPPPPAPHERTSARPGQESG